MIKGINEVMTEYTNTQKSYVDAHIRFSSFFNFP